MRIPLPRHGLFLRFLRSSLVAGAVYDVVLAALLFCAPEMPERLFGVPRAEPGFYLWVLGVALGMLAAVYLLGAYDPVSYRGNVVVAILGRSAAGLVLVLAAHRSGLSGLYVLAAGDLFFGVAHAVFWWPIRR